MCSVLLQILVVLLSFDSLVRTAPAIYTPKQEKRQLLTSSVANDKASRKVILISFISIGTTLFVSIGVMLGIYIYYRQRTEVDPQMEEIIHRNGSRTEGLNERGEAPPPYALAQSPPSYLEMQL
ncbi:hypothetical protein OnM2_072052 [Erysiphe neolycopersici]|uniref:Uncharacterized protein n=1 Tax=Erysiphe neolycopersici TaxID=212602 RepID=A0A420HK20_9PEZI|nr:hypothetical protein OnM2_072052 [Erysiphe neolycopersici]